MRTQLPFGEIRFATVPPIKGSNVIGVVGYVPEEGDPIPLLPVRSVSSSDHDYAIASVMGEAEDRMIGQAGRLAARTVGVGPEADAIVDWMRRDFERRGSRSDSAPIWADRDEAEMREFVRLTLTAVLRSDAFRTCQEFCQSMQIGGNMELVGIVGPACDRTRKAAGAASVAIESAKVIRVGFERNPAWAAHGPDWIEAVAAKEPAPGP